MSEPKPFSFEDSPHKEKRKEVRRKEDAYLLEIKNAHEQLAEAHRQLKESQIEMIYGLAIAAEHKDADTGGHILRISDYATELGKAIGLSNEDLDNLRYASPMHDIGKIGIPDRILQKPGKLDAEEWEVMKTHPVIGARFFQHSKSPLLKSICDISISHHERFDGSGYPYGLKGNEIPLFGRIVAVVDVFDAIVSKRCYKEKWPFKQGAEYIESLAGNHLDPELVKAFVSIQDNVKHIFDANELIQQYITESKEDVQFKDIDEIR